MIHRFVCSVIVVSMSFATSTHLFAERPQQFPYKATVEGNDVYARSGPGRNYYPTAKLKPGQEVTVHRHDPGGWYMIAPPPESFSWIRADYVKQESSDRGTLTENDVIVRVGSVFGDDRDVEQVRLSKGDVVNILDEKTFASQFGNIRMFKIAPPRGEYRWVPGRHIVPVGESARKANDRDPYKIPSHVQRKPDGSHEIGGSAKTNSGSSHTGNRGNGPQLKTSGTAGGSASASPDASYARDRQQLTRLDDRFHTMIDGQPATWDLNGLEAEYLQLKQNASHPLIARKVNRRLASLQHYRSIKAEYQKMIQLTSRVAQRDAELAGKTGGAHAVFRPQPPKISPDNPQSFKQPRPPAETKPQNGPVLMAPGGHQPPAATLPEPKTGISPPQTTARGPVASPSQPRATTPQAKAFAQPNPNTKPTRRRRFQSPRPNRPAQQVPQPQQTSPAPQAGNQSRLPNFDGAGIIRRVRPQRHGMPPYGLFAPDGRLLAYVQPVRGLPIERHLNRPMGVFGKRIHRPEWGTDFIEVRAMMPVRLLR